MGNYYGRYSQKTSGGLDEDGYDNKCYEAFRAVGNESLQFGAGR